MRFAFTDDQLAFRDAVRDLLTKECPPEVVRAAWPDGTDQHGARKGEGARAASEQVDRIWGALAAMGVLGIAVSEERGGLGMGELDWVLLAEETGFAALPHPFVETVGVVAPLLDAAGDPEDLVAGLIDGSRRAGAVPLAGTLVPWGGSATYVVSLDHDPRVEGSWTARRITAGGGAGPAEAPATRSADTIDAGRHVVHLDAGGAGAAIGGADDAARAFDRGALGVAAQLLGLGRRMLELTVAYVAERRQFGVPVGSQQAVKHQLADVAKALQFAAPAVYAAAWALDTNDPHAHRTVSVAKALASDAAHLAVRNSLQCHGAIGYTVEYDLHLYLKRAASLSRSWGDAAWHRRRVATSLGI